MNVRGQKILIHGSSSIGDKGAGALGLALVPRLQALGATVVVNATSGQGFAGDAAGRLVGRPEQRTAFLEELRKTRPNILLMIMGANPTGSDAELGEGIKFVMQAAKDVGAALAWVGPAVTAHEDAQPVVDRWNRVAPSILGKRFHDATGWTDAVQGRTADGSHFTRAGGEAYAPKIVAWLVSINNDISKTILVAAAIAVGSYFLLRSR